MVRPLYLVCYSCFDRLLFGLKCDILVGCFIFDERAMNEAVFVDINHTVLYVKVCKESEEERESIHLLTRNVYCVGVYGTKRKNRFVTRSPKLSLPHPPPTPTSIVCLLHTPKEPVSGDIYAFELIIL